MTQSDYRDFPGNLRINDLADRDARLLLDIGLVRAADGSLRLAEDPSRHAVPAHSDGPRSARGGRFGAFAWLRWMPLR